MRREKHTIQCPCERAKQFPIVLQYDETKADGPNTQELHCPFCQDMLTIELPGTVQVNEQVFRGTKKEQPSVTDHKTDSVKNRNIAKLADSNINKVDSEINRLDE